MMKLTIEHLGKQYRHNFWGRRDFDLALSPGVISPSLEDGYLYLVSHNDITNEVRQ